MLCNCQGESDAVTDKENVYCHCNGGYVLSYCKEECLCIVTVMEDMYCHTVRKNVCVLSL